eukprot:745707-Amphidinium_carterae.1
MSCCPLQLFQPHPASGPPGIMPERWKSAMSVSVAWRPNLPPGSLVTGLHAAAVVSRSMLSSPLFGVKKPCIALTLRMTMSRSLWFRGWGLLVIINSILGFFP